MLLIPYNMFRHNKVHLTSKIAENVSLNYCMIGKFNFIGRRCSFFNVKMGNYCSIGPDVHMGGMQHSYWWYSTSLLLSDKCKTPEQTIIGNDVWIGAQSVIKHGVKIGNGVVVGANSFVNKDVPDFAIVVGSPAKILKYRFDENISKNISDSRYWEKSPKEARVILDSLKML